MAFLANLGPCIHRGGSCACPGVVSRVVVRVLMPGHRLYTSSRIQLTGDLELYNDRRGGVPSARALTVLGMALQFPGWRHSAEDGRTGPEVTKEMPPNCLTSQHRPGQAPSWWLLSYGPPWAHYLGGYQDRLLGGPLGLPGLRYTASEGVEHKDSRGVVLG
jgi:hypothetical protein